MSDLLSIKRRAEKLREAYGTENPFIIAEGLGIVVLFRNIGSLKGFYTIEKRIPYIVINSSLDEYTAKVVCAHELGHDRLHKRLARNGMLNEYELYLVNTKTELEANTGVSLPPAKRAESSFSILLSSRSAFVPPCFAASRT